MTNDYIVLAKRQCNNHGSVTYFITVDLKKKLNSGSSLFELSLLV